MLRSRQRPNRRTQSLQTGRLAGLRIRSGGPTRLPAGPPLVPRHAARAARRYQRQWEYRREAMQQQWQEDWGGGLVGRAASYTSRLVRTQRTHDGRRVVVGVSGGWAEDHSDSDWEDWNEWQ